MKVLLLILTLAVAIGFSAGFYYTPELVIAKTTKDSFYPPNIEATGGQNGYQTADKDGYAAHTVGNTGTKSTIKKYIEYHRQKEKLLQQL